MSQPLVGKYHWRCQHMTMFGDVCLMAAEEKVASYHRTLAGWDVFFLNKPLPLDAFKSLGLRLNFHCCVSDI